MSALWLLTLATKNLAHAFRIQALSVQTRQRLKVPSDFKQDVAARVLEHVFLSDCSFRGLVGFCVVGWFGFVSGGVSFLFVRIRVFHFPIGGKCFYLFLQAILPCVLKKDQIIFSIDFCC